MKEFSGKTVVLIIFGFMAIPILLGVVRMLNTPVYTIHALAESGDWQEVKGLLKKSPGLVRSRDEQGRTPLHLAVRSGHMNAAKWLLIYQSDVHAKDHHGNTPISLATTEEMIALLRNHDKHNTHSATNLHGTQNSF